MVGAWLFACCDPWCPIVGNTWNVDSFDRWSSQNSIYTITYLQQIEPECRFVGLLRHLGDHQSFLGEKYRYRHVWFWRALDLLGPGPISWIFRPFCKFVFQFWRLPWSCHLQKVYKIKHLWNGDKKGTRIHMDIMSTQAWILLWVWGWSLWGLPVPRREVKNTECLSQSMC